MLKIAPTLDVGDFDTAKTSPKVWKWFHSFTHSPPESSAGVEPPEERLGHGLRLHDALLALALPLAPLRELRPRLAGVVHEVRLSAPRRIFSWRILPPTAVQALNSWISGAFVSSKRAGSTTLSSKDTRRFNRKNCGDHHRPSVSAFAADLLRLFVRPKQFGIPSAYRGE